MWSWYLSYILEEVSLILYLLKLRVLHLFASCPPAPLSQSSLAAYCQKSIHCNLNMGSHFKIRMSWKCLFFTFPVIFKDVVSNESLFLSSFNPSPECNLFNPEFASIWRDPLGVKLSPLGAVLLAAWASSSIIWCIEVSRKCGACSKLYTLQLDFDQPHLNTVMLKTIHHKWGIWQKPQTRILSVKVIKLWTKL